MTTDELTATIAIPDTNWLSAIQPPGLEKQEIVDVAARIGVKDNRELIDSINTAIEGGVHFIGKTTSELSDGSTTNPIVVDSKNFTAHAGDMVIMDIEGDNVGNETEFIFDGQKWCELGSINGLNLGDLAFKDDVSASYTPSGSVSLTATADETAALTGTITINEVSPTASVTINSITPEGSVTIDTISPTGSFSGSSVTPTGTVNVKEISSLTFAGEEKQLTATFSGSEKQLTATFSGSSQTLTCNATLPTLPNINVNTPNVSLTPTTTVAGAASVTNGVLSFSFNNVISTMTAVLDANLTASYASDYNTALSGTASMTPSGNVTVEAFTPAGTVAVEKFTPVGSVTSGTKEVEKTLSINSITPEGSISINSIDPNATFSGSSVTPTGTVAVDKFTPTGSVSGNVTIPGHSHTGSFSGTAATITAS